MPPTSFKTILNALRALASFGMIVTIYGLFVPNDDLRRGCFFFGALLMLPAPLWERNLYFISLDTIVVLGTGSVYLNTSPSLRAGIPLLAAAALLPVIIRSQVITTLVDLLGIAGFSLLAIGYAIESISLSASASLLLAVYSLISFRRGVVIAALWALLNLTFFLAALLTHEPH